MPRCQLHNTQPDDNNSGRAGITGAPAAFKQDTSLTKKTHHQKTPLLNQQFTNHLIPAA